MYVHYVFIASSKMKDSTFKGLDYIFIVWMPSRKFEEFRRRL